MALSTHPDLGVGRGIKAIIGRPKGSKHTTIASLLFDREEWTPSRAKGWLQRHGFRYGSMEEPETGDYRRFPQRDSSGFQARSFRTIEIPRRNPGPFLTALLQGGGFAAGSTALNKFTEHNPGLAWSTFAGGTSSHHGYGYTAHSDQGEYHISAPTTRRGGYTLMFANTKGAIRGGLWHTLGMAFRSPQEAKTAAARHYASLSQRHNPFPLGAILRNVGGNVVGSAAYDALKPEGQNMASNPTSKQAKFIRDLMIDNEHAHPLGSLLSSSKSLPHGPSMRERGQGVDAWIARLTPKQASEVIEVLLEERQKHRNPSWKSFSAHWLKRAKPKTVVEGRNALKEAAEAWREGAQYAVVPAGRAYRNPSFVVGEAVRIPELDSEGVIKSQASKAGLFGGTTTYEVELQDPVGREHSVIVPKRGIQKLNPGRRVRHLSPPLGPPDVDRAVDELRDHGYRVIGGIDREGETYWLVTSANGTPFRKPLTSNELVLLDQERRNQERRNPTSESCPGCGVMLHVPHGMKRGHCPHCGAGLKVQ